MDTLPLELVVPPCGEGLGKPAAQQEDDQRNDGQDHEDCDQHDEPSFQRVVFGPSAGQGTSGGDEI